MEDEMWEKMQQWVDDGFFLYIGINEMSDDENMQASIQSIKECVESLDDDGKFRFKAEVMGRFLTGLNEQT